MKLIQIFVLTAAMVASTAAQTGGQTSDPAASSSAAKSQKQPTPASTDSKKKDSAKPDAASKKSSSSTQAGGIKVIVPTATDSQAAATSNKNSNKNAVKSATPAGSKTAAGVKPVAPVSPPTANGKTSVPASGHSSAAAKKTAGPATGKSPQVTGAASSTAATQGSKTGPGKPPSSEMGISPASKQAANKKNTSASQGATKSGPVVSKVPQPRIVTKKPSREELVAAAKVSSKISSGGRRDPFVSQIRTVAPTVPSGPNCSTGKRCLAISELTVQGTAKDTDGKMMAIVASSTHRSYFLRENDQVFNGSVQKITSDSVIFREMVTDSLGRQNTHEVVKKINPS